MDNRKTTIIRSNPKEYERIKCCINNEENKEVTDLLNEIGYLKELNSIANDLNESYRRRIEYLESDSQ